METPAALADRIARDRPDVVIAGYWQLLEWLPEGLPAPVIADCVAPRPLEQAQADPVAADLFLKRYLDALEKADLILAGNRRQRLLLAGWLMARGPEAQATQIITLPLGCRSPAQARARDHGPLILVSGGREWPWRRSKDWHRALADGLSGHDCEIHLFGATGGGGIVRHHPMVPWSQWQEFLSHKAHVGLELAAALGQFDAGWAVANPGRAT